MDGADEKLTALKKAYADIILSISKEAAARVIASERKSVMYQHELKVAKDEGVRMLMRLKQMMDSQISEAEAEALNQQKKIEELEAQLQEAEDIVRDLREELGEVQTELERLKNASSNNLNGHVNAYSEELPMENKISSYLPPIESSIGSDSYIRNRDLPSIIVRGKDPGLYRNGRTQRIRACERKVLEGNLCVLEESCEAKNEKNGEQKEQVKLLSQLEKKLFGQGIGTFKSFSRKKKRAIRHRKSVIALKGKQSYLSPKINQLPEHSAENSSKKSPTSEKDSENGRNIMEIDEGESEKVVPLRGVSGFSEGLQSPDCKLDAEKVESNLSLVTIGERVIKYTYQRKRKRQALSGNGMNGTSETEKKTGEGQNGNQPLEQPKPGLLEGSLVVSTQCGPQVDGDRKAEQPKPSLSKESSRDRRRLAQVARQLISLSEKKWWN